MMSASEQATARVRVPSQAPHFAVLHISRLPFNGRDRPLVDRAAPRRGRKRILGS
jgi:hypothetical protein